MFTPEIYAYAYEIEDSDTSCPAGAGGDDDELCSYADLDLREVIGIGAFGCVWRGELWGSEVAVKVAHSRRFGVPLLPKGRGRGLGRGREELSHSDVAGAREFRREVRILRQLRHPNCVLFLGACVRPRCIVTEYLRRGSLHALLHDRSRKLSHARALAIAADVARGVAYLHSRGIVHRDLKSANILLADDWTAKVADFGLSSLTSRSAADAGRGGDEAQRYCTSVQWRAPEAGREGQTFAADVYSFAILLWEVVTRKQPFAGLSPTEVRRRVCGSERPQVPDACPTWVVCLLNTCWQVDPARRPTFASVLLELGAHAQRPSSANRRGSAGAASADAFEAGEVLNDWMGERSSHEVMHISTTEDVDEMLKRASDRIHIPDNRTDRLMYGRSLSAIFKNGRLLHGLSLVHEHLRPLMSPTGVVLSDPKNDKLWMISLFNQRNGVHAMDEKLAAHPFPLLSFAKELITPIVRDELEAFYIEPCEHGSSSNPVLGPPSDDKTDVLKESLANLSPAPLRRSGKPLAAVLATCRMKGHKEALRAVVSAALPRCRACLDWCGIVALTNHYTNTVVIVNFFTDAAARTRLVKEGIIAIQIEAVRKHLTTIPVLESFDVITYYLPDVNGKAAVKEPIGGLEEYVV